METKEKWIDETMSSLDSLQAVPLSHQLTQTLLQLVPNASNKVIPLRPQIKWAVSAGIILLIGINIFSLFQYSQHSPKLFANKENPVFVEYFAFLNKE